MFRKWGRNSVWKQIKKKTTRLIRKRRKAYNLQKKAKILSASANGFHDCVKAFVNNENKTGWTPMDLFPGKSRKEAAESMAEFFNNISNEYEPLDLRLIPKTFDSPLPTLTPADIIKEVKDGKKPKSRVEGDIFINVLTACVDVLAEPITKIFNAIPDSGWPQKWKMEHVTIIPKCKRPESESECRNISCTNLSLIHI